VFGDQLKSSETIVLEITLGAYARTDTWLVEAKDFSTRHAGATHVSKTGSRARGRDNGGTGPNLAFDVSRQLVFRNFEIIGGLKIQPKPRAGLEVPRKAESRIWCNPAALVNNLCNSRHWDMKIERQPIHAELKRFHELGSQNFARVDGRKAFWRVSHDCP
jgi:hypothetical protein